MAFGKAKMTCSQICICSQLDPKIDLLLFALSSPLEISWEKMEVLTKLAGSTKLPDSITRSGHLKVGFSCVPFVVSNNIKYIFLCKMVMIIQFCQYKEDKK